MKKIDTLEQIPRAKYQGFLWYSDEKEPKWFKEEQPNFSEKSKPSFIVEGMLYDAQNQRSIMINQINGRENIVEFKLNEYKTPDYHLEERIYKSKQENIKLYSLWKSKLKESTMEDIETLQPVTYFFGGFSK